MKFSFAFEVDKSVSDLVGLIKRVGDSFQETLEGRSYGSGVKEVIVLVILTHPSVDHLHKKRRIRYLQGKKSFKSLGLSFESEDLLEFSIKPDFEKIASAPSANDVISILRQSLNEELKRVAQKKIDDFNIDEFSNDLLRHLAGYSVAPVHPIS